jgi:D-alanyl-D-alanine endopeptidase (penicillin-binding protein 7)
MGRSALGIVFSLLLVIFAISDANAATSNTAAGKKASAKKAAVVKKKARSPAVGKRQSSAKKQAKRKRKARVSVPSGAPKSAVIDNRQQKAGYQPVTYAPARPGSALGQSAAEMAKTHLDQDLPDLKSNVALVMDQSTSEVLYEKNAHLATPIASITKLMTSLIVVESKQNMDELLTVTEEDIDREKNTYSRLRIGSQLTRANMLHIALMSSENRAASALGRHYPGGMQAFVAAMNAKAAELGMTSTRYVEPTGLSSNNVSSARDLAKLVVAAYKHPIIRQYSTDTQYTVDPGGPMLHYKTSNRLVLRSDWEIGLQKTGYISEAGNCLVMQATIEGRPVVMIFLDAKGKLTRSADAIRIRKWLESAKPAVTSQTASSVPG